MAPVLSVGCIRLFRAHGLTAASRATGWPLKAELHGDEKERLQATADIVASISAGKPVPANLSPSDDMTVVYGYGEGGGKLLFRDYHKGDQPLELEAGKTGWLWLLLGEHKEAISTSQAVIEGLRMAVHNWRREVGKEGPGEYWYGLPAYEAWTGFLQRADELGPEDRLGVFGCSWWCYASLLDARRAGEASACRLLRRLRRFTRASDQEILAAKVGLQEVQFALAMEYGFADWAALVRHLQRAPRQPARLQGLRWRQRHVTQLGCIKGCLQCLGAEISWPWLYGGMGVAFAINTGGQEVHVSGPTAWGWQTLLALAPSLGFEVVTGENIQMKAAGDGFARRQRRAWDFVRSHIDRQIPCVGWYLHPGIPDYYVICG